MKRLSNNQVIYAMSKDNKPFLTVKPGETVCFETKDCYSNNLKSPQDTFTKEMWDTVNPATGPLYIEGAHPGDILCIDIEKIETRDFAVMCVENGAGALAQQIEGIETTIYPIKEGNLIISDDLSIPLQSMIGVIGTAPSGESVSNGTPGEHGSNMDCKEIGEGSTVYLPVNVQGALLSLGDLHAVMGDGEVCICGAEVSGEVTLSTRIMKNPLPTPCVETKDSIAFIGSSKTLDECEAMVLNKGHRFLTGKVGLSANEAARIMSLIGELRVCQVVDPLKTMKFMFSKNILKNLGFKGID